MYRGNIAVVPHIGKGIKCIVPNVRRNYQMRSNKDLTNLEFEISLSIKRALNALGHENVVDAKNHLYSALFNLHR